MKCGVFAASIEPDNDTFRREGGVWEGMIVPVYAHSPALMCPYFHGLRKSTSIGIMGKKKKHTQRRLAGATDRQCVISGFYSFFFFLDSSLFWAAVVYQLKAAEHIHRKHLAAQINTSAYTEMICVYMLCLYLAELGNE